MDNVGVSRVFNNVFHDNERAMETLRQSVQPFVRNNVFLGTGNGLYFSAGGVTTWPDYYIGEGFDSDFNHFASESSIYVYANWSGMERALDLSSYQEEYKGDMSSGESDPMLDEKLRPISGSPVIGSDDPSVYTGATKVNRGLWPFAL